ncbi:MAG: GAF domain-containing protein [bacterium]
MLKIIDRITDNITDRIISKKHVRNINYKTDNVRENIADLENLTNVLEQKEIELDQHIKLMEYENNILLTLSKSNNLYEVLEKIVNSIELICDHCYGSILTKDGETLRDMCSPNVPKEYANKLKDGFPIGKGYGTCGEVAHTKKELYIKDIAKHPNWSNFPDIQKKALKSGIKSCYSVPILNDKNEVLGTIAIYITCDNINFNLYDSILK